MGVRKDVKTVNYDSLAQACPILEGLSNLSGLTVPPAGMNNAGTYHWSFG